MKKYLWLYCCILLLYSCRRDHISSSYKVETQTSSEEYFSELVELQGVNFGPKNKFGLLTNILFARNGLIVKDEKKNHAFYFLDSTEALFPFQPVGDGPNEIENPSFIKLLEFDNSSNLLYFFDFPYKENRAVKVEPESIYDTTNDIPNSYWGEMQSAIGIDDSLIAITGLFPDTKFILFDEKNGVEVLRSENVNSFANQLSESERVEVSPRNIAYNRRHDLLVLWNSSINSIYTYSPNGRQNKFYSFGELRNISSENVFNFEYFYYYSVKTQNDIVYGLYLGEERKMIAVQDFFLSSVRPELHVYNLITDELIRFRMDRVVNVCTIDVNNNVVYCIEENNEEQPLVRYEIPQSF